MQQADGRGDAVLPLTHECATNGTSRWRAGICTGTKLFVAIACIVTLITENSLRRHAEVQAREAAELLGEKAQQLQHAQLQIWEMGARLNATTMRLSEMAQRQESAASRLQIAESLVEETASELQQCQVNRRRLAEACVPCEPPWENWRITTGEGVDCELVGSDCMQTKDHPNFYGAHASCVIEFASNVPYLVSFIDFDLEYGYDYLFLPDQSAYTGQKAPKAFSPPDEGILRFTSDYEIQRKGWKMCLREPCENLACPAGWLRRPDAHLRTCTSKKCTDDDIPGCCQRGCGLPDSFNDSAHSAPSSCLNLDAGELSSIQNCTIGCEGGAGLDGFQPPQLCNHSSGVFQLPGCRVQSSEFPWRIEGPCQTYGPGCVSNMAVGETYGSNEFCRMSHDVTLLRHDESAYRLWVTYLDTERHKDTLTFTVDSLTYSGFLEEEQGPMGPNRLQSIEWSTDALVAETGFIVCAQAQCRTMTCPEGYFLHCNHLDRWCTHHDCSQPEDVTTCCGAETETFLRGFNVTPGEAADASWCSRFGGVGMDSDFVGQLVLTMSAESGISAEEAANVTGRVLGRDAGVTSSNGALAWADLGNRTIDIVFRLEGATVDLSLVTDTEILAALNWPNKVFDTLELRTTLKVPGQQDARGWRTYGSMCQDLHPCDSADHCWSPDDFLGDRSCGNLHEEQFCTSDPYTPSSNFCQAAKKDYPQGDCTELWNEFMRTAYDYSVGQTFHVLTEVCCTCGGGQCSGGTFRRFPHSNPAICVPCLSGTAPSADGIQCVDCAPGRFAATLATPECNACPSGQYSTEEGGTACMSCETGKVAQDEGMTACVECQPGYHSHQGTECVPCAVGHFSAGGASECEACPAGQYAETTGATECTPCREGSAAGARGRSSCEPCGTGKFAASSGMSACDDCPPGQMQDEVGAVQCEDCEIGKVSVAQGQSFCIECPPGMEAPGRGLWNCMRCPIGFFKDENSVNCTECGPGTFAIEEGLTECRQCWPGWHANKPEGATICFQCQQGTFAAAAGVTSCEECPLGRYGSDEALTECQPCIEGEIANTTGLSECEACSPGSFAALAGLSFCEECSAGLFALGSGASECKDCASGDYGNESGMSSCLSCPPGMRSSSPGSTSCVNCQQGRFAENPAQTECNLCEPGSYASHPGMSVCTGCDETRSGDPEYWTTMQPPPTDGDGAGVKAWSELRGAVNDSSCGCRPGTQPVGDVCEPCGEGVRCLGMGVLEIEKGYAWDFEYSVWDCSLGIEEACPGGEPGRCKEGRDESSIACAVCLDDMVPAADGSCVDCKGTDFMIPCIFAIIGIGVAIVAYCVFDNPNRKRPKLSFLLIMASAGQLVTIVQQLGIISLIRVTWKSPLISAFRVISALTFLDLDLMRPSCVFDMGIVTRYGIRIGAVFILLFVICFAHLVSQLVQHRHTWRTRWPSLWCALGTVVLTFFVSIVSTMLGPMQCRKHPNSRQTVAWYPSIPCWEGGDHTKMIAIGAACTTVPVVFLVVCLWAVYQFPRRLLQANTEFLNQWAFLFFRYTGEAYWYGPAVLIRNALISICPVMISPVLQILSLELIMLFSLIGLLVFMPWRIKIANYLDASAHVCLITVSMLASFFVDDGNTGFVAVLGIVFICAIPALVLIVLLYGVMLILESAKKPYQFFLCHHKAGAGCFCRLLKIWLMRSVQKKVFIDSDDLTNLDMLFDVVAHETDTLVAVNSPSLLQRPWCIGEISTAHRSGVNIIPVYTPGMTRPTEEFVEKFLEYVPDISCLTQFNISLRTIQQALRLFQSLDCIQLPEELHDGVIITLSGHLLAGKVPAEPLKPMAATRNPKAHVIILCNKQDSEAASSALILWALFNPLVQQKENALATVLALEDDVPETVKRVMLICTNAGLTRKVVDSLLYCEEKRASVLPIMNVTNFIFPSVELLRADPVFQSMTDERQERAICLVQDIFMEIAVDFQPSALSGTEATLKIKASEIAKRLFSETSAPGSKQQRDVDQDDEQQNAEEAEESVSVTSTPAPQDKDPPLPNVSVTSLGTSLTPSSRKAIDQKNVAQLCFMEDAISVQTPRSGENNGSSRSLWQQRRQLQQQQQQEQPLEPIIVTV